VEKYADESLTTVDHRTAHEAVAASWNRPSKVAIVVGDACTDDTAARIDRLADPRIRFINLPHRGPTLNHRTDGWWPDRRA
jgi:hypothetical protein